MTGGSPLYGPLGPYITQQGETNMLHCTRWITVLLAFLAISSTASAQALAGRAGFGATVGGSKYFGEFSDNSWYIGGDIHLRYNPLNWLALQAQFTYANPRFRIDVEDANLKYTDYFGVGKLPGDRFPNGTLISGDTEERRNNTRIFAYELLAFINIIPGETFVPYIGGGIGMMSFQVRPGLAGGAGLGQNAAGQTTVGVLPGEAAGLYDQDKNGGVVIPVGGGFEWYLSENFVLNAQALYRFTTTEYLDDYNPGSMKTFDPATNQYTQVTAPLPTGVEPGKTDKLLTLGLGITFYVFGSVDSDGDGLSNSDERRIGTDERNPDTDGEGLPDGYEHSGLRKVPNGWTSAQIAALPETTYRTNPLKADTDDDGLNDREELVVHKTNPINPDTDSDNLKDGEEIARKTNPLDPDTDADGLIDGDEVNTHKTDPLKSDTDTDGLSDGDEIKKHNTNPTNMDTDADQLNDGEEVNVHKTNPNQKDTDADGLMDGEEVKTYLTNPKNIDTDNDGLNDGDEVRTYKTNPNKADTDGEGLTDGDEIKRTRTNPLDPDTDKDGYNDFKDRCPLIPGVAPDGCPAKPKVGTITNFPGVLFIVNTDNFNMEVPGTLNNLYQIKALIEQCPDLKVEIEGHASSEGAAARNHELSHMRATAVKNWLIGQGVSASRVTNTVGYGSSRPHIKEPKKASASAIEAARVQNRRIAVRIAETCK